MSQMVGVDTKPCKHCSHPVAFDAEACPSCGGGGPYPMTLAESAGWDLGLVLTLGALFGVLCLLLLF